MANLDGSKHIKILKTLSQANRRRTDVIFTSLDGRILKDTPTSAVFSATLPKRKRAMPLDI